MSDLSAFRNRDKSQDSVKSTESAEKPKAVKPKHPPKMPQKSRYDLTTFEGSAKRVEDSRQDVLRLCHEFTCDVLSVKVVDALGKQCSRTVNFIEQHEQMWNADGTAKTQPETPECT
jgi:hypothetical protein